MPTQGRKMFWACRPCGSIRAASDKPTRPMCLNKHDGKREPMYLVEEGHEHMKLDDWVDSPYGRFVRCSKAVSR